MFTSLMSSLLLALLGPADDALSFTVGPPKPPAIIAVPAGGRAVLDDRKVVRRIGVTTRGVDEALAYHLGVDPGRALLVASTQPSMPAREAGVSTYDVIVSVDGVPPLSSDVLRDAVQTRDEVVLVVRRGADTKTIAVPVREVVAEEVVVRGLLGRLGDEVDVELVEGIEEIDEDTTVVLKGLVERTLGASARLRADAEREAAEQRLAEVEKLQRALENAVGAENVLTRFRSAAEARERATLEEAKADLARQRAEVEAKRAEIDALRAAIADADDADPVYRKKVESELARLDVAATDLRDKQSLLELKAGEALLRRDGSATTLVLPSDRALVELRRGGDRDADLDGIRERLDELSATTREILEILKNRSAR